MNDLRIVYHARRSIENATDVALSSFNDEYWVNIYSVIHFDVTLPNGIVETWSFEHTKDSVGLIHVYYETSMGDSDEDWVSIEIFAEVLLLFSLALNESLRRLSE